MALSIGELAGYLTLDDSQFEKGLNSAKGKFEGVGSWLKDNGAKIGLAAGAALGAAVAAGVVANINIGAANDKLSAQLGLSAKESGRVGKVAGDLYRNAYGDSIEGVNDAVGAVMSSIKGMGDASSKDLERVTAKALDFATAFEVDVERAAQVAGQAVSTGLAKDADEAFDLIVAASQKVPAALREDVLDASDEYGQFFAGLGYDGEQAFAMIVDAAEKGAFGIDKTGDAIKEFTIRTTDGSKASAEAYEAIGLSADEMANDILAGGDKAQGATQKIIDGILGIKDPAKQSQAAIALFGTPIEDLNTKDIPKFLESMKGMSGSMDDSAGAAARMGDGFNDNFKTKMTNWRRSAEGFIQDGIMALVPALEKGAEKAKDFGKWVDANEKPIRVVGGVLATILIPLLIASGVQATISATKQVAAWVMTQAGAIKTGVVYTAQVALMAGRWAFLGVQAMLHAAKIAAAWLISMGPIGLVIAAVVGLTVVVVRNWERIKEVIAAGWNWVREKSVNTWQAVSGAVSAAWSAVKEGTRNATLWVLEKALWFAERMLGAMAKAFGWAPGIGEKLKAAHEKVKTFREQVNAEMDRLQDKRITVYIGTKADFATPSERRAAGGASGGEGASGGGGRGLGVRVVAPMDQVHSAIGGVESEARSIGEKRATELAPSAAGRVLPKGAYSIGMPYMGYPGHYGADYPAPTGTPIYAMASGRVTRALTLADSYGKHVYIAHPGGVETRYAHMNGINASVGQAIMAGQQVGTVGSTGNSTGPHLHFEYRVNGSPINPATLGLFDHGGLATGPGLMVKGPMPERVLNERQTEAFEAALDRNFGNADDLIAAIEQQTAALKAAIDAQPGKAQHLARMGA